MRRFFAAILLVSSLRLAHAADAAIPSLLSTGRVDEAIAALHLKLDSSPNDAAAHNLLCRAYFSLGEWDRSLSACERAVSLAPQNSEFHLWLGRTYGEKADKAGIFSAAGLARKSRAEFETAVNLDPNSVDARSDLAEFYLEAPGIVGGGRDKAEKQATSLATLDPARAHWVSARIAEKKKDFTVAENEYKAAIDASHGSASAWMNLGLFYKHREQYDQMVQALGHVRSARVDRPDALVDAAEILIHTQHNIPEAVELLRAYMRLSNQVEQAPAFKVHYLLGTAAEKLGNRQNAAAEYRTALSLAHEFHPAQEALERVNR